MATLGFSTIVTQVALAWKSVTGGGIGVAVSVSLAGRSTGNWGFYYFCLLHRCALHVDDRSARGLAASAAPWWRFAMVAKVAAEAIRHCQVFSS